MKNFIAVVVFCSVLFSMYAQNNTPPKPNHDFDFWIGEWVVYHTTADTVVGYSQIESIIDSFAIRESYQAAGSKYRGTSINKFNPATKLWEQYWVDNGGLTLHLTGGRKGDKMILQNHRVSAGGANLNMITWHHNPDGTVRQVWEFSQDGGKTWSLAFDGTYRRKNK